jgi:hypothetical protein
MGFRSKAILGCFLLTGGICLAQDVQVKILDTPLNYSFGYDSDLTASFVLPPTHTPKEVIALGASSDNMSKAGRTGNHWLVVFQAHTDQELNLTNVFNPKMRTLRWGTPYDNAVGTITKGSSAHDNSALLRAWFAQKVRKFATFICIPPKSEVRFWSGYAAPMSNDVKDEEGNIAIRNESRPGGGMQWRFYSLPKNTICLTTRLFTEKSGKKLDKEDKTIDLQGRFAECVKYYNENTLRRQIKLPKDLATPRKFTHPGDDEEIINFYVDKSRTKLSPYVAPQNRPPAS